MKEALPTRLVARIAENLTEIRKEQGISHEKLAAKIGVHRSAISLIESGKRSPSLLICFKISLGLGVSLGQLIKQAEKDLG